MSLLDELLKPVQRNIKAIVLSTIQPRDLLLVVSTHSRCKQLVRLFVLVPVRRHHDLRKSERLEFRKLAPGALKHYYVAGNGCSSRVVNEYVAMPENGLRREGVR